jgi:hypothetical protein
LREPLGGRTDGPESIFKASEPVPFLWALIEKKEPKGEFCFRTAFRNETNNQHTHTHAPSKWVILHGMNNSRKKTKQDDALLQGPCNAKDEKEAEKHVSMAFGPEICWFRIYCVRCFPNHRKKVRSSSTHLHSGRASRSLLGNEAPETLKDETTDRATMHGPSLNFNVVIPTPKMMNNGVDPR